MHALRRRGRRRRLADEERARTEARTGSRSPTDIPTNAIGSIAVDPNDPTGKTIYVGTGEANASGDSEAGLGLYKSTDEGDHWSLVPARSPSRTTARSRGSRSSRATRTTSSSARAPARAATARTRRASRAAGGDVAGARRLRVDRRRRDVLAHAAGLGQRGQVRPERPEHRLRDVAVADGRPPPLDRRAARPARGRRSSQLNRGRFSFSPVDAAERQDAHLPLRRERRRPGRAGLPRRRREPAGRDADGARTTQRWTRLSNPTDGTPGFAVYNYCNTPLVGSQCVVRHVRSCRRPTGPTWSSSAGSCTTRS